MDNKETNTNNVINELLFIGLVAITLFLYDKYNVITNNTYTYMGDTKNSFKSEKELMLLSNLELNELLKVHEHLQNYEYCAQIRDVIVKKSKLA